MVNLVISFNSWVLKPNYSVRNAGVNKIVPDQTAPSGTIRLLSSVIYLMITIGWITVSLNGRFNLRNSALYEL